MVDNYPLTIDSNTEIEPLDSVRDVRMRGQSVTQDRVANIPQMTGATASTNGGAGVVPAPNVADRDKYLKGDGTWAEVSASGSNVQVTQVLSEGTKIATISVDDVPTDIFAPEGGGTVTDVVDGDGTSLVDENGVAHVLGEVTDVVDVNNFSLVSDNVAKIPFEVDSTICSPIPDYANITDIEESMYWTSNATYTWTAPCDCLLVPVVNNDTDFVEYTIGNFTLYSAWNSDSISTVSSFPISNELIPLAKDTQISIKFLHRYDGRVKLKYRYIPFKRLQTNRESYPQPYLDYSGIRTVSTSDLNSGYTAPTDGVFVAAYSNSSNRPVNCYINEQLQDNKYYFVATGNTPNSSMRLGEGDTIRMETYNLSGNGWFLPFATTDDPTEVYMPVPDYSNTTTYTDVTIPQSIPRGFLFNDYRHTTTETTDSLSTVLTLRTATVNLNLITISPVPTYETDRYSSVSWFSMSGTETFDNFIPGTITGETLEGSFISIPYSTQNILVEGHFNVDDVVDGDGNSLVDANGIAHVTAKIKDVLYDDVSAVNDDGVAELFTQRKPTILPLLDYENEVAISASTSWRDTTVRKWTAPCDCIFYIFDHAGTTNTFVKYTIGNFVYYGTCMSQDHSAPYGLLSNMIPLKKGQEISIQFQGQMMNNYYTKAYYIPYKTVDESAESFPLPYLDHNNRISIDYYTTSFTAPTDGMVVDYGNSVHSIVVHTDVRDSTFYGKGGSQYFDCSLPLSAGDNVTLGTGSSKYFIPFKRTTNINRLVSPIPDYANRVAYTGDTLPTSFSKPGFLFLCAHDYTQSYSSASATYNINSQASLDINAYKYTAYWKDSFAPVDETMIKSYVSTGTDINYYFIPYSEFNTVYVKDVIVGGASVVGDGSVARIDSLVTDVQLNGESLVSDSGVANVTGKVFDVQLEGISILDNNEVANIKTPISLIPSPVLDYDRAAYINESNTWNDRDEHTWVAPCDCVIYACSPSSYGVSFTVNGFTYKGYKNAYGTYNNQVYNSFNTMLPVAKDSTVTIQFYGAYDAQTTYKKIAYIPFKKATTLQNAFSLPYLNYSGRESITWSDPVADNDRICKYTADVDGYIVINLKLSNNNIPIVSYTVNNSSIVNIMTQARNIETDLANGLILGKGDTVEIFDKGFATSYEYVGNIYFIPFATTTSIQELVSPIPDYINAEEMDVADFPTTYESGYIFNCRAREGDNLQSDCIITLSDSVTIYTRAMPYNNILEHSHFPISGNETYVSLTDATNAGKVYYVPYSEAEVTSVLVSDVRVDGTSVVDSNGVANITGAGGSTVTVTQIQSTGTKIAEIDVDGTTTDLYAPNGGGGGSTVSVTQKVSSGENIASVTVDGVTTELYATNTTYSDFSGATSQVAGLHGLVPAPTTSDVDKYLKGDGTWSTVSGGGGAGAAELTLIEYNALTTEQKNDGTIRFILEPSNISVNTSNATAIKQGDNMSVTPSADSVITAWNNISTNIGCVYYFPIDVTNYKTVEYTLSTGTAFSTTTSNAFYAGISSVAPDTFNYNPGGYEVYNQEVKTNLSNESRSLDVSNLTGTHYFIVRCGGWNSTVAYVQGVPDNNPTQIKYMSKTYALGEFTGATLSENGINGDVPAPTTEDINKYLRGNGEWSIVSDQMTIFEYNNLTNDQKNDGSIRFIADTGNVSVDISGATSYANTYMTVTPITTKPTGITTTWTGTTSSSMSCTYYVPIDLTNALTISYKVSTGNSQSTTGNNRLFVGISRNAPSSASYSPSSLEISNIEDTRNMSATTRTLDVSSFTGTCYFVVKPNGWNSTVSDVQVISESVSPQIKYMSHTYALFEDFDGATSQADGTHGLVPAPTTSDTAKFLKGDGTWGTPDSGSDVSVTQIQSTGTKIATVTIDNVDTDLYAPNGGGGGSTVSINRKVSTGENFADITIDGVTTQLYATDTTYNDYSGATSQAAGTHGLVPSAAVAEKDKFLKGDGSWDTPDAGSDVSVTQILSSGTKLGTITVDNVDTDLYAPTPTTYSDFVGTDGTAAGTHGLVPAPTASDTNKYLKSDGTWATVSGGGGATDLDDLSDVDITTPSNGQVLKYNSTSQKWENGTGGGGASDLDDLTDVDITSPTGGQILKYNSTTQKWENVDASSGGRRDLFGDIDTLAISSRYASGSLSGTFAFSMDESDDTWSTNVTIYNSTAIDLTDYDELEFDVTITSQSGYGAFWLTLSETKYTWDGNSFPTIYLYKNSAIKITESGTYTVDVSNLIGDYYIYLGGTTGKPDVGYGDCSNSYNGGITGSVSSLYGIIDGANHPEVIEIEWTAYNALTPQEQADPTKQYFVKNIPSGSGSAYYSPLIYSTDEREVGVWTDGKPLYQKTIILNSVVQCTSGSWTDLSVSSLDIDKVICAESLGEDGVYWQAMSARYYQSSLNLYNSRGSDVYIKYVTLRYTKTTDTAGSGSWTPSGVPAVHYSTDEQVVGTWIDGSTLYQKTIGIQSIPSNSSDTFSYGINNAVTIRDYKCMIIYTDGGNTLYWDINTPRPDSNNSAIYSTATKTGFFIRTFVEWTASANLTIWYTKDNN